MTLRRVTALGLAAFLLHLNVVRADAACGAHTMPAGHGSSASYEVAPTHESHGDPGSSHNIADEADCETPSQQDCCQMMSSCGPLLGFEVDKSAVSFDPLHDAVVAPFIARPLSRNTAPEPPPPRL